MSLGQSLTVPFDIPIDQRSGTMMVTVTPDSDPKRHGLNLILPDHDIDDFVGFPMCKASVRSHNDGYASIYGWVQLVKAEGAHWEMDPTPIHSDCNTPFSWFGPEPTLFDAPKRAGVQQIDWTCRSFLTYIRDSLMSKNVVPILGFEWGFQVTEGKIQIKALEQVDLQRWDDHLHYLRAAHPGWNFASSVT